MATVVIIIFLSAVAGVSCSENFPSYTMPASFDYYRFQGSRIMEKTVVHEGDPAYDAIRRLVSSHRAGWNIDFNTYAPALAFQSKNMIINCRDDLVVVNFRKSEAESMTQFTNKFSGCMTKVIEAATGGRQEHDR